MVATKLNALEIFRKSCAATLLIMPSSGYLWNVKNLISQWKKESEEKEKCQKRYWTDFASGD